MVASYDLGIGNIEVFDDYLVAVFKEGVSFDMEHIAKLVKIGHLHFMNKNFVYISLRKYSYAMNPLIYLEGNKISNLKGVAVVTTLNEQIERIKIETEFYVNAIRHFYTMEDALKWKDSNLIQSYFFFR